MIDEAMVWIILSYEVFFSVDSCLLELLFATGKGTRVKLSFCVVETYAYGR